MARITVKPADGVIDILATGAISVDDILLVPGYPAADGKVEVLDWQRRCGGLAATALVAAVRLGARCTFAGTLGHDELSRFAIECLAREGVDIGHVVARRDARPIHSVIVVDERTGTRNIFFDTNGFVGADSRSPRPALIRRARVLLIDHLRVERTLRIVRIAKQAAIPIVADLEGGTEEPGFDELVRLADHLVLSEEFACALTGAESAEGAVRALWRARRRPSS